MSESLLLIDKRREALRSGILSLGDLVRKALMRSVDALRGRDLGLARAIVAADAEIHRERRALEQQALVVLAAYQPAGPDLRTIGASLQMISGMGRIADDAADIARILLRNGLGALPERFVRQTADLGAAATAMFDAAIAAYAGRADATMGGEAAGRDDRVDRAERLLIDQVIGWMRDRPTAARDAVGLLSIAHGYERVADRASDLAGGTSALRHWGF